MSNSGEVRKVALATWFPRDPGAPVGGVEAVSVILAEALARREELAVHVVTVDRRVTRPEISHWKQVTVHRLPRGGGPLLPFALGRGGRMIRDYLRGLRPDIVHAHDTFGIMTRGLELPLVFTIHGFIHEDTLYKGGLKAKLRASWWKRAELASWARQSHIVSISPYVSERLRNVATGTIHEIENPVAREYFEVRRDERPGTIFSAATICERKNTLGLVRAFSRLASRDHALRLRLAGPVVEPVYGRKVLNFIEKAGLSDQVTLLGSISASQVREELSHACVSALLSFEEGAPMGIAEAMAAGVPVVASNRCGMPYMVEQGETGYLVDPDDHGEIADSLNHLLSDCALRTRMGAKAREVAAQKFHPDLVAQRTLLVYEAAIAGHQNSIGRTVSSQPRSEAGLPDPTPNDRLRPPVSG